MKLGEAVYKSQQKNAGSKNTQPNQGAKSSDKNKEKENVVDADFEEVKEDKDDKDDKDKQKRA